MRVLIMEADPGTAEVLAFALKNAGWGVERVASARVGIDCALAGQIGAVIVDQSLSDMNGFDVCRILRQNHDLPIMLMTACTREETVLRAFAAGADDVMIKPLRLAELVARIQAIIRRAASRQETSEPTMIERGLLRLDRNRLEVTIVGRPEPVRLTPLEARLLGLLMRNANQVMSKVRLQELVWGYQNDSSGDLLKTHIRHLRVKIEQNPSLPKHIQTINGVGYTFVLPKTHEVADLTVGVPAAGGITLYPAEHASMAAS
ncbi:MAG: response regulator transcription factor [Cyanobacteria bacterium NC_groundwater_1444_Ag_S-0.65um_54_12]|nr:response regulator transcription factor [Cyanobacteria bacterium NC_groundwater_1444_Ag_S-0.65um_54_12]